jgi:NDP-sugar pyrophosphorylase family protein
MKAMVLAAGLGTRLRPLTNDRPKALVTVDGRTLLQITIERLRAIGVGDIIVNVHHFAEMMIDYLKANNNFGLHIEISCEEELLDTGGGLKKAAWFFLGEASNTGEPFILHNVDVISNIDLTRMVQFHIERRSLATLAVQTRKTSRYLLFDDKGQLCGRRAWPDGKIETVRPVSDPQAKAFSGIHIISPDLLTKIGEEGAFSIIPTYLRLAGAGEKITGFDADDYYWRDLGKPDSIAQAEQDLRNGVLS